MTISATRDRLRAGLEEFCWAEWSRLGVLAEPRRASGSVVDLEALVVLSLRVGRHEVRLFDEVLGWLVVNARLVSNRRLKTMGSAMGETSLIAAVEAWVAAEIGRAGNMAGDAAGGELELLHPHLAPPRDLDRVFARHGWARPFARPVLRTTPPDVRRPEALGLRLRLLVGVGARAETLRVLLTSGAPWMTAAAVTLDAGYAKRNVHEALSGLVEAGVVGSVSVGGQVRYSIDRGAWQALLEPAADGGWPRSGDWPHLFDAALTLLRFLSEPGLDERSDYLSASRGRDVLEAVRGSLARAGVAPVLRAVADRSEVNETVDLVLRRLRGDP